MRRSVVDRILARVTVDENGCHIFQSRMHHGYAKISLGSRAEGEEYVHRVMYAMTKGPIPEGLHIDHLCRNRACCNPEHLEAVTQAENNRRAAIANRSNTCGVRRSNQSARNPWVASISINGRNIHLGLFPTQEAALAARREAERQAEITAEVAQLKAGEQA